MFTGLATETKSKEGLPFVANDTRSLSHTKWNEKYHIVFAPKYRRQERYGKPTADIGQIVRKMCEAKGAEIIEAEVCPDYIRMLVSIAPPLSVVCLEKKAR